MQEASLEEQAMIVILESGGEGQDVPTDMNAVMSELRSA